MSAVRKFPIVIDLSAYFHDHRRIARICVNNSINTINDLQERITTIFSINNFYLTSGNHFLPELEEVGILQKDETICAIPKKELTSSPISDSSEPQQPKLPKRSKEKRRKRSLEIINEELDSDSPPETSKCKKLHKKKEICIENRDEPKKKKKRHVEEEVCNIEGAQTVREIKKKFKEKTEQHIKKYSEGIECENGGKGDIKDLLPKLQSHINSCNDLGRLHQAPDQVRLSRHVDTPIKNFTKYVPPSRITDQYLSKNKVNIVKIDVIQPELPANQETPPKSTVKEIINSFEEKSSPENKVDTAVNEPINDENNDTEKASDVINEKMNTSVCSTPYKCETPINKVNSVLLPVTTDMSLDISSIAQTTTTSTEMLSGNSLNSSFPKPASSHRHRSKEYTGIGQLLENLRESDSVKSMESDSSENYVTKRKRIRKRKKKDPQAVAPIPVVEQPYLPKPLNTKACPSMHIKFDDDSVVQNGHEIKKEQQTEQVDVNIAKTILVSDEETTLEDKNVFSEAYIEKSPQMKPDLLPKVGDIISFKILKINANFSPELSNILIGKVERYNGEEKMLFFKILRGGEELVMPSGKLSVNSTKDEASSSIPNYHEASWDELLDPRLLFP